MKEFITALDPNYQLDKNHIKNNVAIFYISSKMQEVQCPYCGTLSSKVHSFYEREIQDLLMQNRKVVLLVKTRRLVQNILFTSAQLSSVNTAKVLKSNSIEVGKNSICSLLKKMPSAVDKFSVKKVQK